MDGRGQKNSKNPRTCINGMFPKGPPTHGHPCPNMVHQKILQCQCSSEGQVVACPGRLWMVTTDFATSDSCMLQMEMAASPDSALVIITPSWHRRHLTPMALEALTILTEAVFGCATFNSPMHDNRKVVLAVGGYEQATAQVLDYSQPNPSMDNK